MVNEPERTMYSREDFFRHVELLQAGIILAEATEETFELGQVINKMIQDETPEWTRQKVVASLNNDSDLFDALHGPMLLMILVASTEGKIRLDVLTIIHAKVATLLGKK